MMYNRWNDRRIAIVRELFMSAVRYVAHNGGRSVEIFEYLRLVKVDKGTVPGLLARMCARRKQAGSPQITYLATGPT